MRSGLQLKIIIGTTAASAGAALCGCTVGPDYRAPEPPNVQAYTSMPTETSSAPVRGGESQRLVLEKEIPERWWSLFRSEALDRLIRLALKDNLTIAAAQATLRRAEENLRARYGAGRFPSVDVNLSADREKFSGAVFGQPEFGITTFNPYNTSVNVSYLLDIFGGLTRELEALHSQTLGGGWWHPVPETGARTSSRGQQGSNR